CLYFCFYFYRHLLYLHSFPTRRSSDLLDAGRLEALTDTIGAKRALVNLLRGGIEFRYVERTSGGAELTADAFVLLKINDAVLIRSEEHTSELQSLAYLVCRLLLEKKKT